MTSLYVERCGIGVNGVKALAEAPLSKLRSLYAEGNTIGDGAASALIGSPYLSELRLLSLSDRPRHGYALLQDIESLSEGRVKLSTGTLYGALVQNIIAGPIAEKLGLKSKEEAFTKEIILQGVLSIQAGNNPRVVEMQLLSFLSSRQQAAIPKAA